MMRRAAVTAVAGAAWPLRAGCAGAAGRAREPCRRYGRPRPPDKANRPGQPSPHEGLEWPAPSLVTSACPSEGQPEGRWPLLRLCYTHLPNWRHVPGDEAFADSGAPLMTTGLPQPEPQQRFDAESALIKLHKPEDFEGMRRAGRLAAEVLDFITPHVVPGVTT